MSVNTDLSYHIKTIMLFKVVASTMQGTYVYTKMSTPT